MQKNMNNTQAPVTVGEEYKVNIDSVGNKGDGVARVKGFILFVKGVRKGDFAKVKVTKVMEKAGFAELVEVMEKPKPKEIPDYKEPEVVVDTAEYEEMDFSEEF